MGIDDRRDDRLALEVDARRTFGGRDSAGSTHCNDAALVDNHVGQHTRPLELVDRAELDRPAPPASSDREPSVIEVIEQLAAEDASVALVRDALVAVASERDRALFLEVLVQTSLGDRAASATVAALVGMKPEAVRQQVSRIRRRLRELAATDPRYAGLAELAIVA